MTDYCKKIQELRSNLFKDIHKDIVEQDKVLGEVFKDEKLLNNLSDLGWSLREIIIMVKFAKGSCGVDSSKITKALEDLVKSRKLFGTDYLQDIPSLVEIIKQ